MKLPANTKRLLASKFMENFQTYDAILFAVECIELGVENNEIFYLSQLDEKADAYVASQTFWEIAHKLGLKELNNADAISAYIESYVLEIIEHENKLKPLAKLYEYCLENNDQNTRVFYLLFWSHRSYELDEEDKDCYYPNYIHENAYEHFVIEAKKYIKEN